MFLGHTETSSVSLGHVDYICSFTQIHRGKKTHENLSSSSMRLFDKSNMPAAKVLWDLYRLNLASGSFQGTEEKNHEAAPDQI